MPKAVCSLSRKTFKEKAKPIRLQLVGSDDVITLTPRTFSTGSMGWFAGNAVLPVEIDGETVEVRFGINATIEGSKDLPPIS